MNHHHDHESSSSSSSSSWIIPDSFITSASWNCDLETAPWDVRCDTDWDKLLDVLEARVNSGDIVAFSACFYCMQWCPLARAVTRDKGWQGMTRDWSSHGEDEFFVQGIYRYDEYVLHMYLFKKSRWISVNGHKFVCLHCPILSSICIPSRNFS